MLPFVLHYRAVKHVQVNVVHCLVHYSTVKHVQVHSEILYKTMDNIHLQVCVYFMVQDNGQHAPAHV
jgi:hypothetical protein